MRFALPLAISVLACAAPTALAQKPAKQDKVPKVRKNQYKRVHEQALELIVGGKLDVAAQYLDECEKHFAGDGENSYFRAILACARGDAEGAAAELQAALERGLPFARFVAGPRGLLAPLYETAAYRKQLTDAPLLVHGPMLGAVTDRSARVWVRLSRASDEVNLRVKRHGDQSRRIWRKSPMAVASAATDYTVALEIGELEPDTKYEFEVRIGDSTQVTTGSLRTFPSRGPCQFRLAFGGGAGYVPPHERAWATIAREKPDVLLLLGDNVYIDAPKIPAMQHYCYYRRQAQPAFRALVASVPVFSIWDDHDFTTNDKWGGPAIDEPAWKRPVWRVFRNNWVNPSYGGGEAQPGCWYSFAIGDVDFFMLDGRYYRTDPKVAQPSMLGPIQKRWFIDAVCKSTATLRVLCSPVPWTFAAKGNSKDTWNGFRAERDEIFAAFTAAKVDGIVLMSADRHRSDLWRIERDGGYALWELNSSRLTNQHVHPEMKAAEFSYNKKQSFGTVDFDTTAADPSITYRIVTIDGERVFSRTLRASQLRHSAR